MWEIQETLQLSNGTSLLTLHVHVFAHKNTQWLCQDNFDWLYEYPGNSNVSMKRNYIPEYSALK